MPEARGVKIIQPAMCPHCQKEMFVCYTSLSPQTNWVLKKEDLDKAKEAVKEELEKIEFTKPEEKVNILAWVNEEENLFGPDDVESIINNIKEKHSNEKETTNSKDE